MATESDGTQNFYIERLGLDWPTALQQVVARTPPSKRLTAIARQLAPMLGNRVIEPHSVWIARAGHDIVGIQVCVPLAGAAVLFWLPAADDEICDRLIQTGLDAARADGCKIAQAMTRAGEPAVIAPLVRSGFRPITCMHQLAHDLTGLPAPAPSGLRFESVQQGHAGLFATTLERTYDDTLDCPELNGRRTIDEILAGHRGQGRYHPDCWWLAFDDNAPVGVVILAEMSDGLTWELAYLGLVPELRRRGFGQMMSLHALHAIRAKPATHLLLAVDERNTPALRLYQSLGFVEVDRYDALLCFLKDEIR